MARKSKRPSSPFTRLCCEPLEDRHLLAFAAIAVNLFEDLDGSPGALIAGDQVEVGQSFFAEITAQEFYPGRDGLASVRLDIHYDSAVLKLADTFDVDQIVTTDLPFFQTGAHDSATGAISDLGGSAFVGLGRYIGSDGPDRFALLRFEALQATAGSPLIISQGLSRLSLHPVGGLLDSQIDFESPSITVVATNSSPPPSDPPLDQTTTEVTPPIDTSTDPSGPIPPPADPEPLCDLATYLSQQFTTLGPQAPSSFNQAPQSTAHEAPNTTSQAPSTAPQAPSTTHQALLDDPAATDWLFVGPRATSTCDSIFLRLEELIAAIAADVHQQQTL
jgi:hypothetical protein